MRKNKYKPGGLIRTVQGLRMLIKDGQWLYLHHTPKHPSIINHMTFKTVTGYIDHGCLRYAKLNEQKKEKT